MYVLTLKTLENGYWQAGILPDTGASIAYGRVRMGDQWIDVLRPTAPADYGNASLTASFIMLPWCNRIRDGVLRFDGQAYQLQTAPEDGTARHGDVRGRSWTADLSSPTAISLSFDSAAHEDVNFPFRFSARAEYTLDRSRFRWRLSLKNEDSQPFPAGFGYHPYFVRPADQPAPQVTIPCEAAFELTDYLADAPPVPVTPQFDFREPRPLDDSERNDLLTRRIDDLPARIAYPAYNLELRMSADPIFEHILLYAPKGKPFFAVEPMTNANDGFNLRERGIDGSGVFVLQPGEEVSGEVVIEALEIGIA